MLIIEYKVDRHRRRLWQHPLGRSRDDDDDDDDDVICDVTDATRRDWLQQWNAMLMTLQVRASRCKFLQHLYFILLQHLFRFNSHVRTAVVWWKFAAVDENPAFFCVRPNNQTGQNQPDPAESTTRPPLSLCDRHTSWDGWIWHLI